ncbi:MAG: hypothetical protein RL318_139 [Fibrobacterota bacterium]|jgi:small subunit ribosomal protein S16
MATVIRLQRGGRKNLDFYRIMVAESSQKRDGRFLEEIGQYDPNQNPSTVVIKEERAIEWLKTGAVPSTTVKSILRRQGVLAKFEAGKVGKTVEIAPRAEKAKKPTLSRKAKAKAEAPAA